MLLRTAYRCLTRSIPRSRLMSALPTASMSTMSTSQQQQHEQKTSSSYNYVLAGAAVATAATAAYLLQQDAVTTAAAPATGLTPKEFHAFKLKQVSKYNHNTNLYVFALDNAAAQLDFPVSSFILTKFVNSNGKEVVRPYTPIDTHLKGELHLLVKTYDNGVMSKHMSQLKPGDVLELKGPIPKLKYEANKRAEIGMVAGGTGITPMLQVLEEIFRNPQDKTKVTLLFANQTPSDILLKERLDALAKTSQNRFQVHYIVDKVSGSFDGTVGHVNEQLIKQKLPGADKNTLIYVCGPPGMVAAVAGPKTPDFQQGEVDGILKKLGYTKEQVFKF